MLFGHENLAEWVPFFQVKTTAVELVTHSACNKWRASLSFARDFMILCGLGCLFQPCKENW